MQKIHLEPAAIPFHLRQGYSGKQFSATVCETVTIPATAGLWEGGSRETFSLIILATGETFSAGMQTTGPHSGARYDREVQLVPGRAIVRHVMFCGKDLGLQFFVHPQDAAKLLPAPQEELTPHQRVVLLATRSFKSSYGGRDRYQMAQGDYSCEKVLAGQPYPSRAEWDAAKADLTAKGLLTRAGAITPAGRNAVPH